MKFRFAFSLSLGLCFLGSSAFAQQFVSPVRTVTCVNQFLRVLSGAGAWTCASVANADLVNSIITLNAGANVGITAPGAMSLGGTYTFGATTDQPQFAGLGLGGAATGANRLAIFGSTSGRLEFKVPAIAGANALTFPAGTTDFSATGGASQVVKQTSVGGALTVARLACADLSDGGGGCSGGVTSPGGGPGAIQYSSGGAFGGAVITGLVLGNGASAPSAYAGTSGAAHQFITALSVSGTGTFVQPVCTDLSDAGTGCTAGAASTATAGIAKLYENPLAIGWPTAIDPNKNIIATINQASTVTAIVGTVDTPVGAAATVSVYKAPSGTACSAGTVLHSGSLNANGTAVTNQTLTVTTSSLSAGDRLCLVTTGGANWTTGAGIGGVTVFVKAS